MLEKYGRTRQATNNNTIPRLHLASTYSVTTATNTNSEFVIFIAFHGNSGNANTLRCCVIHCPVLYEGWNFNFGNIPLDWIQELLE